MTITIKLYSIIRDYVGKSEVVVEEETETVGNLLNLLSEKFPGFRRALEVLGDDSILILDSQGRRLGRDDPVRTGIVHIMPPPEGGANVDAKILGPNDSVSLDDILRKALEAGENTGAVVFFVGVVRKENLGGKVDVLLYEDAGDLSQRAIEEVANSVAEKYKLHYVAAYHYTGPRRPGDLTMVIVVAGESRRDTYPALMELVDRVKREVPLWKKETHSDGSEFYIVGGRPIRGNKPTGSL